MPPDLPIDRSTDDPAGEETSPKADQPPGLDTERIRERVQAVAARGALTPDWLLHPGGVEILAPTDAPDRRLSLETSLRADALRFGASVTRLIRSRRLRGDFVASCRLGDSATGQPDVFSYSKLLGPGRLAKLASEEVGGVLGDVLADLAERAAVLAFAGDPLENRAFAIAAAERAWSHDQTDHRAGLVFADLLARVGDETGAVRVWQQIQTAHPNLLEPLIRIGETFLRLGVEQDDQRLLKMCDATSGLAVHRFPDSIESHLLRGRFLYAVQHHGEARTELEIALERATETTVDAAQRRAVRYHLALVDLASNEIEAARAALLALNEEAQQQDADVLRNLGLAQAQLGNREAARAAFDAARELAPEDPRLDAAERDADLS